MHTNHKLIATDLSALGKVLNQPIFLAAALLIILAAGLFNALPHLHEALWQDEAATLLIHASSGPLTPLLHYVSPNNHIAFTSMLAAWMSLFPSGVDIPSLRLLPLLLFLAAIPAIFFAAHRLGGPVLAVVTALAFATSTVAGNFATQLRGYGPSWLFFSVMLLAALSVIGTQNRVRWAVTYFLSCLIAIAILPTNFFLAMPIALSISVYGFLSRTSRSGPERWVYFVLLASPPATVIIAYAAVWHELISFSAIDFSQWTLSGLLGEWLRGSLSNLIFLIPLIGGGIAVGTGILISRGLPAAGPEALRFALALMLVLGFMVFISLIPKVPFPRTLVPCLPVWLCAICCIILMGIRHILQGEKHGLFLIGLLLFSLPLFSSTAREPCSKAKGSGQYEYDLCYQYFRDRYHPEAVLDAWAALNRPDVPIVSNFEGFFAIEVLGSPAHVFDTTTYRPARGPLPILVVHDRAELESMAVQIGQLPSRYTLFTDTGYFKVYAPISQR